MGEGKAARATRQKPKTDAERIALLEGQVRALDMRLRTLVVWMAQGANSPISINEAERLLNEIGNA